MPSFQSDIYEIQKYKDHEVNKSSMAQKLTWIII